MDVSKIRQALPKDIYTVDPIGFGLKVLLAISLYAAGISLALQGFWLSKAIGVLLIGLMMTHFVELQHQALHNHGFKGPSLNRFVGFFLGLPMLISFSHYQARHLWHHRKVGTSEDSEFFSYRLEGGKLSVRQLINNMLDISILMRFFNGFKAAVLKIQPDHDMTHRLETTKKIHSEYLLFTVIFCGSIGLSYFFQTWSLFLTLWAIPFFFVAVPAHFLVECPEHIDCDKTGDALRNTRTIYSNKFMTWYTNGNNFHVEHHMFPSVPMHRMHDVHKVVRPEITFLNRSYKEFFKSILVVR